MRVQFHDVRRFKLGLQNRAFLHFLADENIADAIQTCARMKFRRAASQRVCASDSDAGFDARRLILGRKTGPAAAFAMQDWTDGTFPESQVTTTTYGKILRSAT